MPHLVQEVSDKVFKPVATLIILVIPVPTPAVIAPPAAATTARPASSGTSTAPTGPPWTSAPSPAAPGTPRTTRAAIAAHVAAATVAAGARLPRRPVSVSAAGVAEGRHCGAPVGVGLGGGTADAPQEQLKRHDRIRNNKRTFVRDEETPETARPDA